MTQQQQQVSQEEIKEIFALFDTTGKNQLPVARLGDALRALHNNPTQAQIAALLPQLDPENSGFIDLDAFASLQARRDEINIKATKEDVLRCFKAFDKDGSGLIATSELRFILTNMGEKLTEKESDELISNLTVSSEGAVSYEELVNMIMA